MSKRSQLRKAGPPAPAAAKVPIDATVKQDATYGSNTVMGAGTPLNPQPQMPVRTWDFQVGQNMFITPRTNEAWTFHQLRSFSNTEIIRLAIETRKDQMESLDWQVRSTSGKQETPDEIALIKLVEKYLKSPDGVNDFTTWARMIFEDLLAIDAVSIERVRSRSGKIVAHDVIDGTTIKVLIDDSGRRPMGSRVAAFQQIIKGRVWADLTNEDLMYAPRNLRPGHVYGYGPVEQIIVTINTVLRRQAMQLGHFTEGNYPAGLLNAPKDWNPDQIKMFQDWFDARLSGQFDTQAKLLIAPEGVNYQPLKPPPLKDDFDEWLARVVMYAFSLPPTPFIKQLNRSTANSDADRAREEGLKPLKLWFKRLLDRIIQTDLGYTGLEFTWVDGTEIDPGVQANIDDKSLRNGSVTIDEVRLQRGKDPLPNGLGAKPLIYTAQGVIPLEDLLNGTAGATVPLPLPTQQSGVQAAPKPTSEQAANNPQAPKPKTEPADAAPAKPKKPQA